MGKVGNRARLTIERPPREVVERFRTASPPDLTDAMNKSGAMRGLTPVYRPMPKCVGTAITVKVPTGDSLMVRKAMSIIEPGDVLVIDGRGAISRGLWGGVRSVLMASKGVAGVIIDGGTRDVEETREAGLPMFARAVCPIASGNSGPGELNFPISCGGVVVEPGDIVVADEEGIAVIPWRDADDVYSALRAVVEREPAWKAASAAGKQQGVPEMERLLSELGCEIIP